MRLTTIQIVLGIVATAAWATMQVISHRRTGRAATRSMLLEAIIESARDAVIGITKNGVVQTWNAGAESLYGYGAAEMIGRPIMSLIDLAKETAIHTTKAGHSVRVELTISPIFDRGGREIGRSVVARNVTQQKLAELELRQARELAESASAAKSAFLASMSHEIRTPMTAMLGYAELLLAPTPPHPAETRQWAQIIYDSGDRLLAVINDILDISKIEAGKLKVVRSACSPMRIAQEVVELLRPQAQRKGLTIELTDASEVPEAIHTDPDRLRQILLNLVGNAIKFTHAGGVSIEASTSQAPGERRQVCFDVIDTGVGIPPQQQRLLFEAFSQVGLPAHRHGGAGLGLAISRRIAQMLGGDIKLVRSDEGGGSTFRAHVETSPPAVRLPARAAEDAAVTYTPTPAKDGAMHVLIADDSAELRPLLRQFLESAGVRVTLAADGGDAVEAALAAARVGHRFDAILMDMQMRHTDGYVATKTLRAQGYEGRIVALTAHAMEGVRERCLVAGCDDYLTKPVRRDALVQAVCGAPRISAAA